MKPKKNIDWAELIGIVIGAWIAVAAIIGFILIATGHGG